MTVIEYPPHKKALEEGGWLEGGTVIHCWVTGDNRYFVSFYVVAFKVHSGIPIIDCIRVFGGNDRCSASISVDKSIRDWNALLKED